MDVGHEALQAVTRRQFLGQGGAGIGALALGSFGLASGVLGLLPLVFLIGGTNNLWHPAAISYLSRRFPRQRGYALSIHALGANSGDALAPPRAGRKPAGRRGF